MDTTIQLVTLIPVVLGVTGALRIFGIKERMLPLIALVLGVGSVYALSGVINGEGIIQGVIVGLAASGLWSGTKNSFENMRFSVGFKKK